MEGYAAKQIAKICLQQKRIPALLVHDKCTSAYNHFADTLLQHPDLHNFVVNEAIDVGHASQALYRAVCKTKCLSRWGSRIKCGFLYAAYTATGTVGLPEKFEFCLQHWSGDHSDCLTKCSGNHKYKPLSLHQEFQLRQVSARFLDKNYAKCKSSNICESVNNNIAHYCPKNCDFWSFYKWYADIGIACWLLKGREALLQQLLQINQLQVTSTIGASLELSKKQKRKHSKAKEAQKRKKGPPNALMNTK